MNVDGVRIVGHSGQPVLLLPGGAEAVDGFFPGLVEGLVADPGCRVIIYDRPGTGASPTDGLLADAPAHLKSVIDELGCGPVVVVGQSLGGAVATLLARDHPEVVAGLALLDPTPINYARGCARLERTMRVVERLSTVRPLERLLSRALSAAFDRQRRKLDLRPDCDAVYASIGNLDVVKLARSVRGITELSAGMREADLPKLPSVVITADRKKTDPIRQAHERVAAAMGAEVVSWPGAAHNLHLTHPDETLDALRDLVRQVVAHPA